MSNELMDPFYRAAAEAVEEAIVNAMVSAESMAGRNGNYSYGIPHEQVTSILEKYQGYLQQIVMPSEI